jgi:ABC-type antimicrobial peptide transport system permease subunit
MKFLDSANIAFMNLWRRKTRAFLTVLGMVIGTAAIVLMVSLGIGINEATIETWSEVGSLTTINVMAWRYQEPQEEQGGVMV